MPKIFEQDGYRFFFYSNEHRPIHVRYGGGEMFDVEPTVELRESIGLEDTGAFARRGACAPTARPYYREVA